MSPASSRADFHSTWAFARTDCKSASSVMCLRTYSMAHFAAHPRSASPLLRMPRIVVTLGNSIPSMPYDLLIFSLSVFEFFPVQFRQPIEKHVYVRRIVRHDCLFRPQNHAVHGAVAIAFRLFAILAYLGSVVTAAAIAMPAGQFAGMVGHYFPDSMSVKISSILTSRARLAA